MKNDSTQVVSLSDAWGSFSSGVTSAQIVWLLFALGAVFIIFYIASIQIKRESVGVRPVLLWLTIVGVSYFLFNQIGQAMIFNSNVSNPIYWLFGSGVLTFISALLLLRSKGGNENNYFRLIYGSLVIVIFVTLLINFGSGNQPTTYAIFFGTIFGISLGMVIVSLTRMNLTNDSDNIHNGYGKEGDI